MSKLNLKNKDNNTSIKKNTICMVYKYKALEKAYYAHSDWKVNRI